MQLGPNYTYFNGQKHTGMQKIKNKNYGLRRRILKRKTFQFFRKAIIINLSNLSKVKIKLKIFNITYLYSQTRETSLNFTM